MIHENTEVRSFTRCACCGTPVDKSRWHATSIDWSAGEGGSILMFCSEECRDRSERG